ncbi:hypothetical protein ZWY2020_005291 [Hordeum vulgare]|nr:hypothetical protein ZWY2020_005291 [Hordeum vulgare]
MIRAAPAVVQDAAGSAGDGEDGGADGRHGPGKGHGHGPGPGPGRARRRGRKRRRTAKAQNGRADGMAVDALALHARTHGRSGRLDGAGAVAPWPYPAVLRQGLCPKRAGMLTWPGQQGPARPRHGVRKGKQQAHVVTTKAALPAGPSRKVADACEEDGAAVRFGTVGGLPFAARGHDKDGASTSRTSEADPDGPTPAVADPRPCRDRCLLRLGPAEQRVRSAAAPPAPRSGQKEPHPSFAAPAPPKTVLDQPPWLLLRAFEERAGRASSPPASLAEATPSPLASSDPVGPAVVDAVIASAPSDADSPELTGVVADAAATGPAAEDPLVTGATPEDAHATGEAPTPDGLLAVG